MTSESPYDQTPAGTQFDMFGGPNVAPELIDENAAEVATTERLLDKYGQPLPVKTDGNTPLFHTN